MSEQNNRQKKWEFADYAFAITGVIIATLLVLPELLHSIFDINFLGGSLNEVTLDIAAIVETENISRWSIHELRAMSPMLLLATTAICFIHDAAVARKTGGYKGKVFTHTFETLLEDAIYMTVTAVMVFGAVLLGSMYISWLAGPITWVLFILIFPLVRKRRGKTDVFQPPVILLCAFAIGIIIEVVTGAWVAFPLAWMLICAVKLVGAFRTLKRRPSSLNAVFDMLYYLFSVVLMAVGVAADFWVTSWAAFPVGMVICWILSKFGKYKKESMEGSNQI